MEDITVPVFVYMSQ